MVTTLTLNPCIDRTVYIDEFTYGGLNRITGARTDIAGKGINVSKVLHNLGVDTVCLGVNYSSNGDLLVSELQELGIKNDFVTVDGAVRTNIKLYDNNNIMTEINEAGGFVSDAYIKSLYAKVISYIKNSRILVLSGSAPPGFGDGIYRDLIIEAKKAGVMTVLDAEKQLLAQGLHAQPDIVKPNLHELESLFGTRLDSSGDKAEIVSLAKEIIARGVKIVCVSLGGDGAVIVRKNEAFYAPPMKLNVNGQTGAGDSMVAGICCALLKDSPTEDILRSAMAAAACSLEKKGTVLCDRDGFEKFWEIVEVHEI